MTARRRWARALLVSTLALVAAGCASSRGATSTSTTVPRATTTTTTRPSSTTTTSPASTSTAVTTTTTPTSGWTEAQDLAQLIMVGASFSDLSAAAGAVSEGAGGLVLFGAPSAGSAAAIKSDLTALQQASHERLLMATDEEGGDVARLAAVIGSVPAPRQMAATMTPSEVTSLLTTRAEAMAALGVNMDLAPVLDTASAQDQIDDESQRSFSEDGNTAALYGNAFITGLRDGGVIPTAKHFPGLGHANGDTDLGTASDPPLSQLLGGDLVPFESAIKAGVPVIMMSNVTEPTWGSTPASLNPMAYRYLRTMGFAGMVVTDSLDAGAIADAGLTGSQAVVRAVEAGADMAMVTTPSDFGAALAGLEQAVTSGQLSMTRVEQSDERIIALKERLAS